MNPNITISNLIRQLLPPHKRKNIRLALLQGFGKPLENLWESFFEWRSNTRMMVNVNCQVRVFEGYLRKKYREPISIKIITFSDGLLLVGLEEEGTTMMPPIGLETETMVDVPLDGEIRERFGDADFIVYIPAGIDINLIRAEIENYKQALTKYKIIQN